MTQTEEFHGAAGQMRQSEWLAAEDIRGHGDVNAVIAGVYVSRNVEFEGGLKKPVVHSIAFVGKERKLIVNAARRKVLVKARGSNVDNWIGCTVTMYVDETVKMKGQAVGGIRFRPEVIPAGEAK